MVYNMRKYKQSRMTYCIMHDDQKNLNTSLRLGSAPGGTMYRCTESTDEGLVRTDILKGQVRER